MSIAEAEKNGKEGGRRPASGELLYCGATCWEAMGRVKGGSLTGNLLAPTRFRSLMGINIRFVASGCTSCHCVALDAEGRCYTWGRNEKGQLGHGDTRQRDMPTIVSELSKYKVISAGAGRNHTVVVTEDGKSFSFGLNKHGQLGTGSAKKEMERSPLLCLVSEATSAVCGGDFTVWLSSIEGSSILTAGLPQYGQLGHGTDNEYNAKESSVRLVYAAQPHPRSISAFSEKTIVKVACGTNHTVAVDSSGFLYTWGFGAYGRLGHREQKDEWAPRLVEVFQRGNVLPPDAIVSAGSVSSACTAGRGQLYMWGKVKSTGDEWMYPKPLMDLSGWNIRCMDSGNKHHVVGADDSCISWGAAQHGELGYGSLGLTYGFGRALVQKSSAYPKKVECLDGMHVTSVACGLGLSLIVVDRTNVADRLEKLEVYEGENAEGTEEKDNVTVTPSIKKKNAAKSSANSKKRKKQEDSLGSEVTPSIKKKSATKSSAISKKRKKQADSLESEVKNNVTVTPSIKKKRATKSSENAKKTKKQEDSLESEEMNNVNVMLLSIKKKSAAKSSENSKRRKKQEDSVESGEKNNVNVTLLSIKKKSAAKSSENSKRRKKQEEGDANEGGEEDEEDSDDEVEAKSKGRKGRGAKRETSGAETKGRGRGRPKKSEAERSSGRGRGRPRKSPI